MVHGATREYEIFVAMPVELWLGPMQLLMFNHLDSFKGWIGFNDKTHTEPLVHLTTHLFRKLKLRRQQHYPPFKQNCLSWFLSLIIASILLRQCKVHCIQVEMSHWTASAYNVVPLLQWKWLECMGKWSATFCTAPVASWFVCFREDTCTAIKSQASEIHWHLLQLIMPEPARFELWKFGEKLKSTESMHWCALPCD